MTPCRHCLASRLNAFQHSLMKNPNFPPEFTKQVKSGPGISIAIGKWPQTKKGSSMDTTVAQPPIVEDTAFVRFWNDVLAPKFIRFKHILVDGLSQHSDAVFPTLP